MKVKLNQPGFRELRKSEAIDRKVASVARRVATTAGPGFEARKGSSQNRSRWYVTPTTPKAFQANRNHALLRAMSAGGQEE